MMSILISHFPIHMVSLYKATDIVSTSFLRMYTVFYCGQEMNGQDFDAYISKLNT